MRAINGYYGDKRETDPEQRYALAALVKTRRRFRDRDSRHTGEVRLALAYYNNGWQPDITWEASFKLNFSSRDRDVIRRKGILLAFDRPVRRGTSKVRIIVRDPQSEALGSLTIPVEALIAQ